MKYSVHFQEIDDLLVKLDKRLEREAGDRVTEKELNRVIESKNKFFSQRLYELIPKPIEGLPHRADVVLYIASIVKGDADAKLQFYFQLVDTDNDGKITESEVKDILKHSVEESRYIFDDNEVEEMAKLVMERADLQKDGYLTYDEFKALFDYYQIGDQIGESLESWLLAKPDAYNHRNRNRRTGKMSLAYIRNNSSSLIFIIFICLVTLLLSAERFWEYQHRGWAVMFARAAGQSLNFFSALILLLVLRQSINFLRTYGFSAALLDKNLYYHKVLGYLIFIFSLIHTIGHAIQSNMPGREGGYLFSAHYHHTGLKMVAGTAPLTGWIVWFALFIIIFSSLPMVRKKGHFEIFHYCHLFYMVYLSVLLLHGPTFWRWLLIPGSIYILERWIIRNKWSPNRRTHVEQATILPRNVVQLVIKRPPSFHFKPGDWVYIQIPSITRWEWHPFTISSAPEIQDTLWLHIRPVGTWTNKVHSLIKRLEKNGAIIFPRPRRGEINYRIYEDSHDQPVEKIGKSKFFASECRINLSSSSLTGIPSIATQFQGDSMEMSSIHSSTMSIPRLKHDKSMINNELENFSFVRLDPEMNEKNLPDNGYPLTRQKHPNIGERARYLSKRLSTAYPSQAMSVKIRNPSTVVFLSSDSSRRLAGDPNNLVVINRSEYNKMLEIFNHTQEGSDSGKETIPRKIVKSDATLSVRIDGPYGSPSSLIFDTEHAILISTGIGVTPFASILRSIMIKYLDSRQQCPHCNNWFARGIPGSLLKLKKVDFVWINRDQHNLEWFVQLLSQLEMIQAELETVSERRFLDMHIYITSAIKSGADIRAAFLRLALDNLNSGRDLVTGLRTRTKPGRPDWQNFFYKIKQNPKGQVAVFYCGPPELGRELHHYANIYQFDFHKEIF